MIKIFFVVYGIMCYLVSLVTLLWAVAFVGDLVPPELRANAMPLPQALLIDLGLISLFGVQHSVMARAGFKRWWIRIVPQPIERSTYVWISNVLVVLLMWLWQPIGVPVWDVQQPIARAALSSLFAIGWFLVPVASLMINHFDLFGTRQVWLHLRRREYRPLEFRTPMLYGKVRHPLYVGWLIAFWATPTMTLGHLVFAAAMTGYILIAVRYEERDLLREYGTKYTDYRRRVPGFVPRLGSRAPKSRTESPVGAAS